MAKYLKLGSDAAGAGWTLPDSANIEKIQTEIAQAMEEETTVRVPVVVGRNQTAELIVNGGEVTAAVVWEDAPAGVGFSIID